MMAANTSGLSTAQASASLLVMVMKSEPRNTPAGWWGGWGWVALLVAVLVVVVHVRQGGVLGWRCGAVVVVEDEVVLEGWESC
jgi:hypothetical protein